MMARQVSSSRNKPFSVKVILPFPEKLEITDIVTSMNVLYLKDRIEIQSGVPRQLQRLTYFDELDMEDHKKLSFYHVVPNSVFRVRWWPNWVPLIHAAYNGDVKGVMATKIRQMAPGRNWFRKIFFNERGFVALFIACHRGHSNVVSRLMSLGIDPCRKMPSGRSAIHVAVFKRRITCVNLLIGRSRDLKEESKYRENCIRRNTFLNIANLLESRDGWKMLVMQLKERMEHQEKAVETKEVVPLREFQKYDSAFSTNLRGTLGRIYLCTVLQMKPFQRRRVLTPWK